MPRDSVARNPVQKFYPVGKAATVAGGADPGRGAERFSEGLLCGEPAANQRFRSHYLEGCGLSANCGNRGQRPQLQWRLCRLICGFVAGFFQSAFPLASRFPSLSFPNFGFQLF